jgi:transcriptional regulator with XRE-family HTH domain
MPPFDLYVRRAEIARRLRRLRKALGLTQAQIARRCGLSTPGWNHYETGDNAPSWPRAEVIAQNCGVTTDWIYDGIVDGLSLTTRRLLSERPDDDDASSA